jgi:predicted aldo/keto reductase-like oxidoreductase
MNLDPAAVTRRQFITRAAVLAGAAIVAPVVPAWGADSPPVRRRAIDQVPLGKTGVQLSRLGMGTGSDSGRIQAELGRDGFDRLVRYAYDRGITYFDTAQSYRTFEMIAGAIKGLPREKLFLQSKVSGQPEDALAAIDRHRKVFNTDYVDSLLIHCMVKDGWTESMKRLMDAFAEAKSRKWIRAHGVSCHSLPALRASAASDWNEVHLVRLNPQGAWVDTPEETWNAKSNASHVPAVAAQIQEMRRRGHGVIGMKLVGNGEFTQAEDREKAARYVMQSGLVDAVVIGFKSPAEVDEAIERIDRALA